MLRRMGAFGAAMTVILLILIAIKSILHYLNPKGENNDQTKRYREHRRFVFGFLSIATLILGVYIITSIKNPELFQEINESTTPGFIYGSRLLVKLLATVVGMSIIAIVLIMLLGMVFCGQGLFGMRHLITKLNLMKQDGKANPCCRKQLGSLWLRLF